jgi:cytochrome b561
MTMQRYHPLLVSLHWLLAIFILAALGIGFFGLAPTPNSDPRKLNILELHMAGGMLIAGLMVVRFVVRLWAERPPGMSSCPPLLNRIAEICHKGFYVLVALLTGTGLATAVIGKLNIIVFARSGDPLPDDLTIYPTRVAHGYLAAVLVALIATHVAAVAYHQIVRKDGVLRRMFLGKWSTT